MRRRILPVLLVALLAWWMWPRRVPRVEVGEATLDLAVYADAKRDAVPVADVVKRSATQPKRPPNVVVVMADDLGYGDLGAYGNTLVRSPRIDDLARRGARFTGFYSSHSSCSPSRAGMLTHLVTHDPLLFDVTADAGESYDVSERHPDVTKRLGAAIDAWADDFFANPRGWRD